MTGIVGMDIGGQGIKLLYENNRKITKRIIRKKNLTIPEVTKILKEFLKEIPERIEYIGVSQAGIVQDGELKRSTNLPDLQGINAKTFESIGIKHAYIINDGVAMAYSANYIWKTKNIFALVSGTGIGSGILINGKAYEGKNCMAGEIHELPILTADGEKRLGDLCASKSIISKYDVEYVLQHLDEPEVRSIIWQAGTYTGQYIVLANRMLAPELIYITGGNTMFPGYVEAALEYAKKYVDITNVRQSEEPFFDGCKGAIWYANLELSKK